MPPPERILLVIPHYRDAQRLEPFLAGLLRVLPGEFSILISDDGSPAADLARLHEVLARCEPAAATLLPLLSNQPNRGKGAAVYAGWEVGIDRGYDWLAFADADGAVSAAEILRGWRTIQAGSVEALAASRIGRGRRVERRWMRHVSGRVFAWLVEQLTGLRMHDTQCGYKVLSRQAFEAVRQHVSAIGFAFDVELLLLLERSGFGAVEFPVDWRDVRGGQVHVIREAIPMLREVVRARRRVDALR